MIEKMNLKTPGREDDDSDIAIDLKENAAKVKKEMKSSNKEIDNAENDREKL